MIDPYQALRRWLRPARGRRRTQQDLADLVGTDQGTVSAWLGGRKLPGLRVALELQRHLRIPAGSWPAKAPHPRGRS